MKSVREFLLGNWRNKGVALFFAITIWFAAYRSEKQEYGHVFRVALRPTQGGETPILLTSIKGMDQREGVAVDFDNINVRMLFSGPRKQIDKIRDDVPTLPAIEIPRDREVHTFSQADFGFPREGVEIVQFAPEAVKITQEEAVKVRVENVAEKLVLSNIKEGFEVASKEVRPSQIEISGPKSIVGAIGVSLKVSMEFDREIFKGRVDIVPTYPQDIPEELVKQTVKLIPAEADVTVTLRASSDVLPVEAMRISFRLPPVKNAVKIVLDDVVGDTIPVEFHGRKDEIARLRERLREQPSYALAVRVPPFDRELGGQFTFTEDALELFGFPGIQIRQHELRRKEKKAGWSYAIVPVKEAEK